MSACPAPPDEVHVWRAALDLRPDALDRLERILSPEERRRAARFRFPDDRNRFVAAHSRLRLILARYLGASPEALQFRHNSAGKPALAREYGLDLRFNLSHCSDLALIAVTRGREVGIDVERLRPDVDWRAVAQQFFTPRETAALDALPPSRQAAAFFTFWTRKEAWLKACGEGLRADLARFEVCGPDSSPSGWQIRDLDAGPDHAAALCVEGSGWTLRTPDPP